MKKSIFAILAILFLVLLVLPVNTSQVKTTQVPAMSSQTWTVNLDSGDTFTGSLSISGGSNNDIDFSVTNPQGTTILGLGRVSQGRSFEFTADQSGAYSFHLGNTFSILSLKTVSLSYDVTHPFLINIGADISPLIPIIAVLVIVIVAVIGSY